MKKIILFVCISAILCFLIIGCSSEETTVRQRLNLSAETAADSYIQIPVHSLNGNFDNSISYVGVKDLRIEIDGTHMPLEGAIGDGLITVEELWAYAMIDARNGFCTEISNSHNGLSYFVYQYPEVCDLYFSHDVYETPSGKNYTEMYFYVYAYQGAQNVFHHPTEYNELGIPYPADMEDWKLTFKIDNISSTGFDIQIYQPNITVKNHRSQHIGQLHLKHFRLEYGGTDIPEEIKDVHMYSFALPQEDTKIEQDVVNTFSISFSEFEGFPVSLPSGSYRICLEIHDEFDEETLHPLIKDYNQDQSYWIQFDIP